MTDELIWGGLGNLRFLQVNMDVCLSPWCTFVTDANSNEAFEILELNCELLSERIKLISYGKGCPPDLVESVSTLIWASAIVDIPELVEIRKQFRYKYGREFEEDAVRNAGGVVNERVASKLLVQPPSAYLVQVYLETIADEHGLIWKPKVPLKASEIYEPTSAPVWERDSLPAGGGSGLIYPSAPPMPSFRTMAPSIREGQSKHMFAKDPPDIFVPRATKSEPPPGGKGDRDEIGDDDGECDGMRDLVIRGQCQNATQTNIESMNSSSFKRSPFANDTLSPTSEIAAGTSKLRLAGMVDPAPQEAENDENLCVVCDESKKQVILMPCKHMCLCKKCAAGFLFKTLHECPMCRAKIEDSMEVFW